MKNISPNIFKQIQKAMQRPEGTVSFTYKSKVLFNPKVPGGILFEIHSGAHIFRVDKEDILQLSFYHSSPGTGTRIATVDLKNLVPSPKVLLIFTWTPKEIRLCVGSLGTNRQLVCATGVLSHRQFRVGKNGSIIQIGNIGIKVMGVRIYKNGKSVLLPTAFDAWKNTVKAVRILFSGSSEKGEIFDVIVANLSLSILVTGFENYCQKRFIELEQEGIKPEVETLVLKFFSRKERDTDLPKIIESEAKAEHKSFLQKIVEKRRINFQNYIDCKNAYNKTYGVKFGKINVSSNDLKLLQRLILYRHRVVHDSPLLSVLNQPEMPNEQPVFPNKKFRNNALKCFNLFIKKLHDATLHL